MIDLSIIIVSYNTKKLTVNCLGSIRRFVKRISYEVIIVDNGSTDGSVEALKDLRFKQSLALRAKNYDLKIIANKENRGFAAANNQGIKIAQGRYILLLNSDTKLLENAFYEMVSWMDSNPRVGIATCQLINPDGSVQATGGYFPTLDRLFLWATFLDDLPVVTEIVGSFHPHTPSFWTRSKFYIKERELDWVTGAFFLIRKEVAKDVGILDEDFFMYVEELEYCLRAKKKGWKVFFVPKSRVIHYGGASGTREGPILGEYRGLKILYSKHYPSLLVFLRFFLLLASFVRILVFAIMNPRKASLYVKTLGEV